MAASTGPLYLADFPLASLSVAVAAATTINQYTHVCFNASGYAVPGADTSGLIYAGMSITQANNNPGAAGAINVQIATPNVRPYKQFNATSPVQSWVGARVFLLDDNFAGITSTNHVCCGTCVAIGGTANLPTGTIMVDTSARFAPATS
jgi:hypothetical protein